MIRPLLKDEALVADVMAARREASTGDPAPVLHVWWLGQSGFLLQHASTHVLLDPYLSDSLTRKYAGTDKPHVRMSERVVPPERLDFIQVVTASHAHTDHLDPDTLRPLAAANPGLHLVCPESIRRTARERSGLPDLRIHGMDTTSHVQTRLGEAVLHAVPAAHEGLERDPHGRLLHLGYVIQLGPFCIYHSGDTVRYPDMDRLLRPFQVDLAILPINGRAPERRVAGNLDGPEAARLARDIDARLVVPCHYDMFEFNTASPEPFAGECRRLGQPFRVLQQGERLTLRAIKPAFPPLPPGLAA